MFKPFGTLLVAGVCAFGAIGCGGSDQPKISSAEYVTKCDEELGKSQTTLTKAQVDDICKCSQKKLVDGGFGDKRTDDNSFQDEARAAGRDCAQEVIAAGTK
jgi:hypothetical protein